MTADLENLLYDSVLLGPRFPKPDITIWPEVDSTKSAPVHSPLNVYLHWVEEQLAFVPKEMLEAVIHSESTCRTLTDK